MLFYSFFHRPFGLTGRLRQISSGLKMDRVPKSRVLNAGSVIERLGTGELGYCQLKIGRAQVSVRVFVGRVPNFTRYPDPRVHIRLCRVSGRFGY